MNLYLFTPELPGRPSQSLSAREYRAKVEAMPYCWKRTKRGTGLFDKDDELISVVRHADRDRFLCCLVMHDQGEDLVLKDSMGTTTDVAAADVVAFTLNFINAAFPTPR